MTKKQETEVTLEINELQTGEVQMHVLGTSPLIMNRFSQKAWQQLLLGSPRKNRAELDSRLKHDPIAEFRGALYKNRDARRPALFHVPNGMFHGALASAALDIPGAKRAVIERLTSITDVNIDLFGVPQFFMAMVRNSDMARTPDVRTRPIFAEWAASVTVRYVRPQLTERVIGRMFGAAGLICGIGDWRVQKGGPYGSWRLVSADDKDFRRVVSKQGRAAQQRAWDHPEAFDQDSEELYAWYCAEVRRREMKTDDAAPSRKPPKVKAVVESGADSQGHNGRFVNAE